MGVRVARRPRRRTRELDAGRSVPVASDGGDTRDVHGASGGVAARAPGSGWPDRGFHCGVDQCADWRHAHYRDRGNRACRGARNRVVQVKGRSHTARRGLPRRSGPHVRCPPATDVARRVHGVLVPCGRRCRAHDGAGRHWRPQRRYQLHARKRRSGSDRRREPVWRTRLLCRFTAGGASHHSGERRHLVPRYRGLVAVVSPGRDDPHVSRALFQEQRNGGSEMRNATHNQAEVMSEFLEPSTSKSKAKPARLPAVDEFSWIWVGLILLFVCSSIVAPGTMTRGSILAMLPFAGILAIVATGQTLVIQQRGLDMSAIGMVSLAGIVMAHFGTQQGSIATAVLLTFVAGAAGRVFNGEPVGCGSTTPLRGRVGGH